MNKNDLNAEYIKYSIADRSYTFFEFFDDYAVFIITNFLVLIILVIALVFAIKFIHELMNFDKVTHLLTRASFYNYIKDFMSQAVISNKIFSIIIMDLDDFKLINEEYGHDTGDEVLRATSDIILKSFSAKDRIFRWGNAEFLILTQSDKEKAIETANRIKQTIAEQVFVFESKKFSLTITGGISVYESGKDSIQMLHEAEENIYKGKTQGKNVVIGGF